MTQLTEILAMADLADKGSNGNVTGGQAVLIEKVDYELLTVFSDDDSGDGTGTEGLNVMRGQRSMKLPLA